MAEVILMDGTLIHLAEIFKISKDLESNLQNSFKINIVPGIIKIGGLLLLNFGILTGIIIDVIFFFIAIGNSMLPLNRIEYEKTRPQMEGKDKLAKKTALKLDYSSQQGPSQEN